MKRSTVCGIQMLAVLSAIVILIPLLAVAGEPYRLGIVESFTGTGSLYSRHGKNGVELAVEEINRGGGFLGQHPITIFTRDDQVKPDVGVRGATDLIIREKVNCIISAHSSAIALGVEEVTYQYKVLQITANSNSESMTCQNYSPYFFQVTPSTYMESNGRAIGLMKVAKEKRWKNYVVIAANYEWGHNDADNFIKQAGKLYPEFKLIDQYWPKFGETDYTSYITAIMGKKPDFVYGVLSSMDNFAFIRQAKSYGFFEKFPYTSLLTVAELQELKNEIPRGLYAVCRAPFFANLNNPIMVEMVKNYRSKFNEYPSDYSCMHYDAVYALKAAIEKAGTIDNEKVKVAMKGMTFDTTRGRLSFRRIDNQLVCPSYLGQIADDRAYPFPILKDIVVIPGDQTIRPESEYPELREKAELSKKRKPEDLKF